jgi:hypothetical protein
MNVISALTEQSCNTAMTPLLRDDQFSASSEYNTKHNASAARKDGGELSIMYN